MTARHYSNSQNSIISFDYSWFLAKNLSNVVSLAWKLHNRYRHNYDKCPKNREQAFFFKNCAHSQAKLLFSQCNFLHAYFFAGRHSWKLRDIPTSIKNSVKINQTLSWSMGPKSSMNSYYPIISLVFHLPQNIHFISRNYWS